MLNPQLLNNLGDFFSTFKEMLLLAKDPQQLDNVIAGLSDAKTTLAQAEAAKPDLAELTAFKTTKEQQLQEIADKHAAVDEAAKLNTDHATALQSADSSLQSQKTDLETARADVVAQASAVNAREAAVAQAEQDVKDTQAKVDQALADANTLKQSYVTKLQALAQTEGAPNGSTGS